MEPAITPFDPGAEFWTDERCWILESRNVADDPACSIARARVAPGVTTARHRVSVDERYVILEGRGRVDVDGLAGTDPEGTEVGPGDVVVIPAGVSQRIANVGTEDLVFLCVCTPRFTPDCYEALPDREPL